jgi:hypothetical protein
MEQIDVKRRGGLTKDDKHVLELIRQTNEQYKSFLNCQHLVHCDPVVPTLPSYNWDRPLTIVFNR